VGAWVVTRKQYPYKKLTSKNRNHHWRPNLFCDINWFNERLKDIGNSSVKSFAYGTNSIGLTLETFTSQKGKNPKHYSSFKQYTLWFGSLFTGSGSNLYNEFGSGSSLFSASDFGSRFLPSSYQGKTASPSHQAISQLNFSVRLLCLLKPDPESESGSNHLKVHKRENFLGFDFEICTFSLLVMPKC
jgi:hypothetical protein